MFGWRRRSDGFEWHKYVRTTIKLRREDRRKKIEDLKDVAAARVVDVGRAGASASRTVGFSLVSWLKKCGSALSRVPSLILRGFSRLLRGLGRLLRGFGRVVLLLKPLGGLVVWFIKALSPRLERNGVTSILALVGGVALVSAIARIATSGFDGQAAVAIGLAAVMLVLASVPTVARAMSDSGDHDSRQSPAFTGRFNTRLFAAAGAVVVCGLIGYAAYVYMPAIPWPQSTGSLASLTSTSKETVAGRGRAITGDTIRIGSAVVRLSGIEAPELRQRCRNERRRRWRCGQSARRALQRLLANKRIECEVATVDTDGKIRTGSCKTADVDLAEKLVARGHVFSAGGFYSKYDNAEDRARQAKRGVWSGKNQKPSEYRNASWERAKRQAPRGCPIKGRVLREGKVYVLPWAPSYARSKVRTNRGERWFCSERDAIAAGWQPDPAG